MKIFSSIASVVDNDLVMAGEGGYCGDMGGEGGGSSSYVSMNRNQINAKSAVSLNDKFSFTRIIVIERHLQMNGNVAPRTGQGTEITQKEKESACA